MNLFQAIQAGYERYSDFKGRASRSEFWYFLVFFSISSVLLNSIYLYNTNLDWFCRLIQLFVFTIPYLAVLFRRLHDTNKSGWWHLLIYTLVGIPVLIYWLCLEGKSSRNRFGMSKALKNKQSMGINSKSRKSKKDLSSQIIKLLLNPGFYGVVFFICYVLFIFFVI
jgi:uncharacterized membrane protein YhaH (DUF805 family)